MERLTGPVSCVLCGLSIWNGIMFEAVPDGDPQYVCEKCCLGIEKQPPTLIKTSNEQVRKFHNG